MGGDADVHAGVLLALARLGHCGNNEEGKSPAPMVPPVQHTSDVTVPSQITQAHSAVKEAGRAEATAFGSRGGKVGNLKGVQRLWAHTQDTCIFKISREINICS